MENLKIENQLIRYNNRLKGILEVMNWQKEVITGENNFKNTEDKFPHVKDDAER